MKFILICMFLVINNATLYSMEKNGLEKEDEEFCPVIYIRDDDERGIILSPVVVHPRYERIMDAAKHWETFIEECDEETPLYLQENPRRLSAIRLMLNDQRQKVSGFISKITEESMEELLDDLLLYRIEYIKLRKGVIDLAKNQGVDYSELALRSKERNAFCQENHGTYGRISYENNMAKSVCLHLLMKEVFRFFPDPSVLNARIKNKLRLQPSLFSYLNDGGEIPWALDYTLGLPGSSPYHEIPDYTLIMDHFEKTANVFQYSTFHKEPALVSRAEAGLNVQYELPYPSFLKKRSISQEIQKDQEMVTMVTPEILRDSFAETMLAVKEVAATDHLLEKPCRESLCLRTLPPVNTPDGISLKQQVELKLKEKESQQKRRHISELSTSQSAPKPSIFSRVEDWLENTLFNHRIKTINGREWEQKLRQIDGVIINNSSGSSHFEVCLNGRCVGGYFYTSTEYGIGYRKWLQKIIEDLGYVAVK